MSVNYTPKKGEVLNGGYTMNIGSFMLVNIGSYKVNWAKEYDSENSFTDYLGNSQKAVKGVRFSISVTTGRLSKSDYDSLITELNKKEITLSCPDFEGAVICDSADNDLKQANFNVVRYSTSFKLTAKSMTAVGSL